MDLNIVWFVLIAVLYIGFFVLEGFDFGVGILLPFLSKDKDAAEVDRKRRVMINTIGPHWDGNEVWLLTAGGATFAAFPQWYATLFSGFYLALFLLLQLRLLLMLPLLQVLHAPYHHHYQQQQHQQHQQQQEYATLL